MSFLLACDIKSSTSKYQEKTIKGEYYNMTQFQSYSYKQSGVNHARQHDARITGARHIN